MRQVGPLVASRLSHSCVRLPYIQKNTARQHLDSLAHLSLSFSSLLTANLQHHHHLKSATESPRAISFIRLIFFARVLDFQTLTGTAVIFNNLFSYFNSLVSNVFLFFLCENLFLDAVDFFLLCTVTSFLMVELV